MKKARPFSSLVILMRVKEELTWTNTELKNQILCKMYKYICLQPLEYMNSEVYFNLLCFARHVPLILSNLSTATAQYRKFEDIPRKGIARPQSQFLHSFVCERYPQDRSAYSAAGKYVFGPILWWYKSLTYTWMWKLGLRARNSLSGNMLMGFSLQWRLINHIDSNAFLESLEKITSCQIFSAALFAVQGSSFVQYIITYK